MVPLREFASRSNQDCHFSSRFKKEMHLNIFINELGGSGNPSIKYLHMLMQCRQSQHIFCVGLRRWDTEVRKVQAKNQPVLDMAEQVQQLSSSLAEAIESMKGALQVVLTAKRQIRRGKNGKAEGVDIMAPDGSLIASQNIQRGPDGRVLGSS